MRTVFVCSPYRAVGPDKKNKMKNNIDVAKRVCRKATLEGYQVACPHLFYSQFLDDDIPNEREIGINAGLSLLELSDEIWVVGNRITEGMSREIAKAGELGIPIKCVSDPLAQNRKILQEIIER